MSKNISSLSGREGKELDDPLWERLQQAAARTGTPDDEALTSISEEYLIGEAITYGTSSFYDFLSKANRGKKAYVCNGSACLVAGTQDRVHHELEKHFRPEEVGHMCCLGRCHENSAFHIGGRNYSGDAIDRVEELMKADPRDADVLKHPGMDRHHVGTSMAQPILTAPMPSLEEFYALWEQVLKSDGADVLNEVKVATVRGRGGAGFPMGLKWESARNTTGERKYIVCNADEGDPAAYSDRYLLEQRPHLVLLGMMIGGYCIGADSGVLYIRAEYPEAVEVVKQRLQLPVQGDQGRRRVRVRRGDGAAQQHRGEARRGAHAPPLPHAAGPVQPAHGGEQRGDAGLRAVGGEARRRGLREAGHGAEQRKQAGVPGQRVQAARAVRGGMRHAAGHRDR
jgi:NADH-quinone oxidoreductase subunit F